MSLTNPINSQNIVDHYESVVNAFANAGIVWGTNNLPFSQFPSGNFGGTTAGKSISPTDGLSGSYLGLPGAPVTASPIYNMLVGETNRYTSIRRLRALLNVTGAGGNTGNYSLPGIIYDQTNVAHMNNAYLQNIGSPNNGGVQAGLPVTALSINTFFENLKSAYTAQRNNTATITVNVCHSSCHNSCHSSRGRR